MADIHIDWAATSSQQGALFVSLSETPDQAWVDAFLQASNQFGSETRGQTWERVEISADYRSVVVAGLDDDGDSANLRVYLEGLVNAANSDAPRERARAEQAQAQTETDARRREENASRMADELRKQSE